MGVFPLCFSQPLNPNLHQASRSSRAHRFEPVLVTPAQDDHNRKTLKTDVKPLPRCIENVADDPRLGNPLKRMERLGPGWLGVIVDYEGVVVETTSDVHSQAWMVLAEEEGKPRPLQFKLVLAGLMKSEQVVSELLCWGREPSYVHRLVERKKEIYNGLIKVGCTPRELPGIRTFLTILRKQNVPVAICSTEEPDLMSCLETLGLDELVECAVSSSDVQYFRPDPEAYAYAAMKISRPPARCAVVGSCNLTLDAAQEIGMQCVGVAGQAPLYQLSAAGLVVKELGEISFVNLKQLFGQEETVEPQMQLESQSGS